ncbi:radical SAM protein [Myxococcota bacterium]|nr:radical SAM protein [Myxococcota bacterium]
MSTAPVPGNEMLGSLLQERGAYARRLVERARLAAAPRPEGDPLPGVPRIFSDVEEEHGWRAPPGHRLQPVLEGLAGSRPAPGEVAVVVVPTRYTFHRLDAVCAFAAGHLRRTPGPLPRLDLRPLPGLPARFLAFARALSASLSAAGVAVALEDPDLLPLLEAVERAAAGGGHEVELLHALGALCAHDFVGVPRDRLASPLHRFTPRVMAVLRGTALADRLVPMERPERAPAVLPGLTEPGAAQAAGDARIEGGIVPPPPPAGAAPIPVALADWADLEGLVARAFAERGLAPQSLPGEPLKVKPLRGLGARLAARVAEVNGAIAGAGLALDLGSTGVLESIARLEGGLGGFDPPRERLLLRLLGVASRRALVGPQTVHVDVIAACQHRCTFCYTYSPLVGRNRLRELDRGNGTRLDFEVYLRLLDELQALDSVDDLLFNGPGEPLLHPRIFDMVREAKRRGFVTTLFTNGLLLDADTVDRLLDSECDRVYWSMHSCTPRGYRAVHPGRPEGEFDLQVRQGAEFMRRKRERGAAFPSVYLVNVLGAETWDEVVPTAELGARMGVDHIRLQLTLSHDDETRVMQASDEQVARIVADLPEARRICAEAGIELLENLEIQLDGRPGPELDRGADFEDGDWSYRKYEMTGCHVGWFFTRIWVDGTLSFCCHPKVVGDLGAGRGFRDVYLGEEYHRLRQVAALWDVGGNVELRKRYPNGAVKGGMLFDKACHHCGNYEHMALVQREMGALSALSDLPRTRAAARLAVVPG